MMGLTPRAAPGGPALRPGTPPPGRLGKATLLRPGQASILGAGGGAAAKPRPLKLVVSLALAEGPLEAGVVLGASGTGAPEHGGVLLWTKVSKKHLQTYGVGGKDLIGRPDQTQERLRGGSVVPRGRLDGLPRGAEGQQWRVETWEITIDGDRGQAALESARLPFRLGTRGGPVALYNRGPALCCVLDVTVEDLCALPQLRGLQPPAPRGSLEDNSGRDARHGQAGDARHGQADLDGFPSFQGFPGFDSRNTSRGFRTARSERSKPRKSQSLPSLHPSTLELQRGGLAKQVCELRHLQLCESKMLRYAKQAPNRVFQPALKEIKRQAGRARQDRQDRKARTSMTPWRISGCYAEPDRFAVLREQKQRNEIPSVSPHRKLKRFRFARQTDGYEASSSDDDPDASPEKRLHGKTKLQLRQCFVRFDPQKTGWLDTKDLPKVIAFFRGLRSAPTELVMEVVKGLRIDYPAVDFHEFLQIYARYELLEVERTCAAFARARPSSFASLRAVFAELGEPQPADALGEVLALPEVQQADGQPCSAQRVPRTASGFLAALRLSRERMGLTQADLEELRLVFKKFDTDKSGAIDFAELQRVFQFMGFNPTDEMLKAVVRQVDSDGSGEIDFEEFKLIIRIYSDEQQAQFREIFDRHDENKNGEIDTHEVYGVVKELGWWPTRAMASEAVELVDADGTGALDFDEFLVLMKHLRRCEGFTRQETDKFHHVFRKSDLDGSGEIGTLELGRVLRNLGYPSSYNLQQRLIDEVDVDGSGEVDFPEFLKLLRKYRNNELMQSAQAFEKYQFDAGEEMMVEKDDLYDCLLLLGWDDPTDRMMKQALGVQRMRTCLPWQEFVEFTQAYRELERELFVQRAGFSETEVDDYRTVFDKFDKDKSGEISLSEMYPLLEALGKAPRNVAQRDKLTKRIALVDEDKSGEIGFPEFLNLMRAFLDDADAQMMQKEKDAITKSKFKEEEVSMWRNIFEKFDPDESGEMDVDETKDLLRTVNVRIDGAPAQRQKDFYRLFNQCDLDGSESLDFPEFLYLIRAFLDVDFGGLATSMGGG